MLLKVPRDCKTKHVPVVLQNFPKANRKSCVKNYNASQESLDTTETLILLPQATTDYSCQRAKRTDVLIYRYCPEPKKYFQLTTPFYITIIFRMNSFHRIKQYNKIFILFLLVLGLSSLIAPLIKVFLDSLLPSSSLMIDLLNYKHGSYDFGRVMRRIIMAVAIVLIFLFRKPLMIDTFITAGIKPSRGWREQLQTGFILGTGMFIFYIILLWTIGIQIFQPDIKSFSDITFRLLTLLLIAGLIGCIEEILFRGFIFQSMLTDVRTVYAIFISSLFYSLLHFFKTKLSVSPGIQPFVGFIVVYQSFENIIVNFTAILPSVIGLFFVGVVLSYACLRTKSLYLAIGLHAGWVFLIKANRLFFDQTRTKLEWLFGDKEIVTGVLGWIFLTCTLILIRLVTKEPNSAEQLSNI